MSINKPIERQAHPLEEQLQAAQLKFHALNKYHDPYALDRPAPTPLQFTARKLIKSKTSGIPQEQSTRETAMLQYILNNHADIVREEDKRLLQNYIELYLLNPNFIDPTFMEHDDRMHRILQLVHEAAKETKMDAIQQPSFSSKGMRKT